MYNECEINVYQKSKLFEYKVECQNIAQTESECVTKVNRM